MPKRMVPLLRPDLGGDTIMRPENPVHSMPAWFQEPLLEDRVPLIKFAVVAPSFIEGSVVTCQQEIESEWGTGLENWLLPMTDPDRKPLEGKGERYQWVGWVGIGDIPVKKKDTRCQLVTIEVKRKYLSPVPVVVSLKHFPRNRKLLRKKFFVKGDCLFVRLCADKNLPKGFVMRSSVPKF